eukprot:462065_1
MATIVTDQPVGERVDVSVSHNQNVIISQKPKTSGGYPATIQTVVVVRPRIKISKRHRRRHLSSGEGGDGRKHDARSRKLSRSRTVPNVRALRRPLKRTRQHTNSKRVARPGSSQLWAPSERSFPDRSGKVIPPPKSDLKAESATETASRRPQSSISSPSLRPHLGLSEGRMLPRRPFTSIVQAEVQSPTQDSGILGRSVPSIASPSSRCLSPPSLKGLPEDRWTEESAKTNIRPPTSIELSDSACRDLMLVFIDIDSKRDNVLDVGEIAESDMFGFAGSTSCQEILWN